MIATEIFFMGILSCGTDSGTELRHRLRHRSYGSDKAGLGDAWLVFLRGLFFAAVSNVTPSADQGRPRRRRRGDVVSPSFEFCAPAVKPFMPR